MRRTIVRGRISVQVWRIAEKGLDGNTVNRSDEVVEMRRRSLIAALGEGAGEWAGSGNACQPCLRAILGNGSESTNGGEDLRAVRKWRDWNDGTVTLRDVAWVESLRAMPAYTLASSIFVSADPLAAAGGREIMAFTGRGARRSR
jgi:hypothetical protein